MRVGAVPESLGVLEPGDGHFHDRRRPLHPRLRLLRGRTAKPFALEADEPQRVAEAVRRLKLRHVVITAVARDDLRDGGAGHFAGTIRAVRAANPATVIEVLTPDFHGREDALRTVAEAAPADLQPQPRDGRAAHAGWFARAPSTAFRSRCSALSRRSPRRSVTKSGLMLGLGETEREIFQSMDDLREAGVQVLTLGQYLRPSPEHLPVVAYIHPDNFALYREVAEKKGLSTSPPGRWCAALIMRPIFIPPPDVSSSAGDRTNVAALIPSYFEEGTSAKWRGARARSSTSVLVVDDGSTDRTAEEARLGGRRGHPPRGESRQRRGDQDRARGIR